MGEGSVLALDLGTSSLKCGLYSLEGELRAEARAPMRYFTPAGLSDIAVEFDPEETWGLACGLVRECLERAGMGGGDVVGVCTTSQRGGFVLLDGEGGEVYSGPNRDVRAFFEGMEIDGRVGGEVYRLTGHTPSFLFAPARLAWLRANAPEVAERTASVLPLGDWLGYRLLGEVRGERSALTEVGLLPLSDVEEGDALLKLVGVDSRLMPGLCRAGEQRGEVTSVAARATGLVKGTPVVAGGPDTQVGLLGMGVTAPGEMGILVGWSGPLQMVTLEPCIDAKRRTWAGRHVVEGRWVVESTTTEAGRSLEWIAQITGMSREEVAFEPGVGNVGGGYESFAFLGPRIMDAKKMGMQMGGDDVSDACRAHGDFAAGAGERGAQGAGFRNQGELPPVGGGVRGEGLTGGVGGRGDEGEGVRGVGGGRAGSGGVGGEGEGRDAVGGGDVRGGWRRGVQ